MRFFAARTAAFTAATHGVFTRLAAVGVPFVYHSAAVVTADAAPQCQLYKWAFGVVGPQNSSDEREKIEEPSLLERLSNRVLSFPFAQDLIGHVGMRDVLATVGRVRILGDNSVRMAPRTPLPSPMQLNCKRSQINSFQLDRLRGHRDSTLAYVVVEPTELDLELNQVRVDLARCGG